MSKAFQISIDTGGTFTDCVATDNLGNHYRTKILSNSTIRGEITEQISPKRFKIKQSWYLKRDILKDYLFLILRTTFQSTVKYFDIQNAILEIEDELPESFENQSISFALTALEEAPVLGARLITETALNESFPPLKMRIGSTKGTNALLEMKGAKTAFLVTKGFKDLLVIGNQARPDIFALQILRPEPLYHRVIEIDEQIDSQGNILRGLNENPFEELLQSFKNQGVESIAICLKNAYKNNIHEKKIAKICKQYFQFVNISTELSKQIKFLDRAETTVVNAYLSPIISQYLQRIIQKLPEQDLKVMTSAGSLVNADAFYAKDSLFSGPAGGVVGASVIAQQANYQQFIAFDMGGTSTDVARFDNGFEYQFAQKIGNAHILSPSLAIETVAAGGGSICSFDGYKLSVGPESAGATPGPACYGAGGPLTITDVNLLLGRLDTKQFSIPVFPEKAKQKCLEVLQNTVNQDVDCSVLEGFRQIANEKMAEAVRKISIAKGYDLQNFALVAFGGAGGLHACGVAEILQIKTILLPKDAGLLSAFGISKAKVERFVEASILEVFTIQVHQSLEKKFSEMQEEVFQQLIYDGVSAENLEVKTKLLFLRFKGQDSSIKVEMADFETIISAFKEKYTSIFGHWVDNREIELESLRIIASEKSNSSDAIPNIENLYQQYIPKPAHFSEAWVNNQWQKIPVFIRDDLKIGAVIQGFALLLDRFSTTVIEQHWEFSIDKHGAGILKNISKEILENPNNQNEIEQQNERAGLELFTNRFMSIAENMGVLLQRTALSVNVKERLDFSCALLDAQAELIANAPHIPVHLGSLGVCVRSVLEHISIQKGDVVITNHPKFGGSHLPDITLVSAVYSVDNELIGYVANRCHHSEVGGIRPASMPPYSSNLAEEGVVIPPMYLVKNGQVCWDDITQVLTNALYPTRSLSENLADLNAALAANKNGEIALMNMVEKYGINQVHHYMKLLKDYSTQKTTERLLKFGTGIYQATERLDDDSLLQVKVEIADNECIIDFSGSTKTHKGNLNANVAIVNSVVVYVLRLLLNEKIPLNDGILKAVKLIIPSGSILNPDFSDNPQECPAVVGGNVELSQRLTDTLLKAFGVTACSQGTMNNFLFGNANFGYYETICGGSGAGDGFAGTSGVHTHMTNTRITDAEVFELRYPVQLNRFEIRENSGGKGKFNGGNGIIREVTFLEPVEVSLLRQHIKQTPYGLQGGEDGLSGSHYLQKANGDLVVESEFSVEKGDILSILTPGGGGFGKVE
ncbi:MAG: hydantoinase B/oxoprolinase family protein [Arcicella sp.]|jgi:5-oxoprolinase (ATP-hydrolysing)|nr:hydantoinase B/oxoprolinase family protein [Arcicella sp.]